MILKTCASNRAVNIDDRRCPFFRFDSRSCLHLHRCPGFAVVTHFPAIFNTLDKTADIDIAYDCRLFCAHRAVCCRGA